MAHTGPLKDLLETGRLGGGDERCLAGLGEGAVNRGTRNRADRRVDGVGQLHRTE